VIRLLFLPFRLVFGSVRVGFRAGRAVGVSRALFFGLGFSAGVLVASPTARRLALKGAVKGVGVAREAGTPPAPTPLEPAAPSGS
jgi:hypothetical protein